MKPKTKTSLILASTIFAALVLVIPIYLRNRVVYSATSCIYNLKEIDGAIRQWALENNITNANAPVTLEAIQKYMGRGPKGELPKCPQGGTYSVSTVEAVPKCSIGGPNHSINPN